MKNHKRSSSRPRRASPKFIPKRSRKQRKSLARYIIKMSSIVLNIGPNAKNARFGES